MPIGIRVWLLVLPLRGNCGREPVAVVSFPRPYGGDFGCMVGGVGRFGWQDAGAAETLDHEEGGLVARIAPLALGHPDECVSNVVIEREIDAPSHDVPPLDLVCCLIKDTSLVHESPRNSTGPDVGDGDPGPRIFGVELTA